jgi:integrase-like protein
VTSLSWAAVEHADGRFCVATLSEALTWFGNPSIFNTDQGTQFTSDEFTKMLQDHGIEISMDGQDGRGCCHGNIFVVDYEARMGLSVPGGQWYRTETHPGREPTGAAITPCAARALSLGRASRVWRSCVAISSVALM